MSEEQYATLRHIDSVITVLTIAYMAMCGHRLALWLYDLNRK